MTIRVSVVVACHHREALLMFFGQTIICVWGPGSCWDVTSMVFEGGVGFFSKALDLNFWAFFQVRVISENLHLRGCFEKVKPFNSGVYVLRCLLRDTKVGP